MLVLGPCYHKISLILKYLPGVGEGGGVITGHVVI